MYTTFAYRQCACMPLHKSTKENDCFLPRIWSFAVGPDCRNKNSVRSFYLVLFESLKFYNAINGGSIGCKYSPGGPLVFEVGYHPRKKIHVIRVVFQDQAMYARTSFRGAKTCKIGKKGMFLVIWQILERTWRTKYRKTHAKTRI